MQAHSRYVQVISGHRRGALAALERASLHVLARGYRSVIGVRNAWYDRFSLPQWLDVPVISVGNLTVGGTGKTPMTLWLCERLLERGLKPAVLSRGYKASEEGVADELLLVSLACPKAVAVANPDRRAAGRLAIEEYGVQVAILDDGFQHRRLGRDLDLVLVDATRPFGYGHVLPRGLLREPVVGLRRANCVVLTRVDQATCVDDLEREIRANAPDVPVLRAVHRAEGWVTLAGQPEPSAPAGRVGAFAGIARPDAFARTLHACGVSPGASRWYDDHHAFSVADAEDLENWARREGLDTLVTTEKDAVKLSLLAHRWGVPVVALRVRIALQGDADTILTRLIDDMLREHEDAT